MRKFAILLVGVLSVSLLQGHKYEPINTEYAPPVEVFILDITPQYFNLSEGRGFYFIPEIGMEMPLTTWSQIEISIPYLRLDPPGSDSRNGLGDLQLGFRALLPKPRQGPILSLNFEVLTPTGDSQDELAGEAIEVAVGLFTTQEFARGVLFGNFSYAAEFPKEEDHHDNILEYSTAAVFHAGRLLHPTLEFFGESNLTERETEVFLAPEIILNLTPRTELKWALPIGLTGSSADWGLQFQLTIFLNEHPDSNLPPPISRFH
ncbi:transporter [Acidobacteria bacterium AH-259-G07]|nr:transporter [Acidobacteria bacterium AH-259-G07]